MCFHVYHRDTINTMKYPPLVDIDQSVHLPSLIRVSDVRSVDEPRHEKTNVLVSDLVRHKPGCRATEDG